LLLAGVGGFDVLVHRSSIREHRKQEERKENSPRAPNLGEADSKTAATAMADWRCSLQAMAELASNPGGIRKKRSSSETSLPQREARQGLESVNTAVGWELHGGGGQRKLGEV